MYRNVYFHKVVRSAEGMVRLALQRARRLAVQDRLNWPPREHYVHRALLGQALSVSEFTELDDVALLHCFKIWAGGDDRILAQLCHGLLFRKLYKVVDISGESEAGGAMAAFGRAQEAVASAGGEPAYELFLDEPADTAYVARAESGGAFCPPDGILVRESDGKVIDFAQISPLVVALNRQLMFRRIHVAEQWRDAVRAAVG
jgi:HD superfamily phosphohydrolase